MNAKTQLLLYLLGQSIIDSTFAFAFYFLDLNITWNILFGFFKKNWSLRAVESGELNLDEIHYWRAKSQHENWLLAVLTTTVSCRIECITYIAETVQFKGQIFLHEAIRESPIKINKYNFQDCFLSNCQESFVEQIWSAGQSLSINNRCHNC